MPKIKSHIINTGTTAVACKQLKRNFIGFEIEPKYVEIANRRLQQNTLHDLTSIPPKPKGSGILATNVMTKDPLIEQVKVSPKQLHDWYLEATTFLMPGNYNDNAQKHYDELNEEQKSIDIFIANKVNEALARMKEKVLEEVRPIFTNAWFYNNHYHIDKLLFEEIKEKIKEAGD